MLQEKEKQQRLKMEMQFAQESSTTLPSMDSLFQIPATLHNNRRRDKTSKEFGDFLIAYLDKIAESTAWSTASYLVLLPGRALSTLQLG